MMAVEKPESAILPTGDLGTPTPKRLIRVWLIKVVQSDGNKNK